MRYVSLFSEYISYNEKQLPMEREAIILLHSLTRQYYESFATFDSWNIFILHENHTKREIRTFKNLGQAETNSIFSLPSQGLSISQPPPVPFPFYKAAGFKI